MSNGTGRPPDDDPARGIGVTKRGTREERVSKIKKLAEKRKGAFKPLRDLDNPAVRGKVFEWMHVEVWIEDLKKEGYTEFYSHRVSEGPRKGELPRGAKEFGSDEFGKVLKQIFPGGAGDIGPDVVALDRSGSGRMLVGDVTAGEWSTATVPVRPGQPHVHPNVVRHEVETVHHLEKTQRDAERLFHSRYLPKEYMDYHVEFQDQYYASERKASGRFTMRAAARPTPTPSAAPSSHINDAERGLKASEKTSRAERAATHGLPHARAVERGTEHGLTAAVKATAREFKLRSIVIGVKAWRAARSVGKVLVLCFVPLTVLDVAFEVAMALWDWDHEKEERKRREKQRALEAVFKEGQSWADLAMGKKPPPSLSELIDRNILNNVKVQEQFMRHWDGNKGFNGFQYARVTAILRIETFRDMRNVDDESLTSYSVETREVYAENVGWDFVLEDVGEDKEVEKTEADAMRLFDEKGPYASSIMRKIVKRKRLKYTIVPPLLTPYDIVVTKMNNLFVDIVQFTAAFTDAGGEIFTRPFSFTYTFPEWQSQFEVLPDFDQPPLNRAVCEYCLGYLYSAAKLLSRHPLEQQDVEGNLEDPRRGWKRRFWLLIPLLEGRNTTYGKNFLYFAEQVKHLVRRGEKTDDIVAALDELYAGARAIWYDLERIEKNLHKAEYYYFGPRYVIPAH